jgi:hypothetical protein
MAACPKRKRALEAAPGLTWQTVLSRAAHFPTCLSNIPEGVVFFHRYFFP